MRTMARLHLIGYALLGAWMAATLVGPAVASPQDVPASSSSTSTSAGTGMVTPYQKWCPPDDPEPCDAIPTNRAPVVSWTSAPASGSWFLPTDTIAISASASDPDGSIDNVRFLLDHQNVVIYTASPYQATVSRMAAGTHTLSAVAEDNLGRTAEPGEVTIYVRNSVINGNVDGVSTAGLITGWACSTYLAQSINVDVYVGGPAGTGTAIGRYLANKSSEAAVDSACHVGGGSYRFQIQLTNAQRVAYGGKTIYVHGISPIGAVNRAVGASGNFRVPLAVRDAQFSAQTLVTAMLPGQTKNVIVKMHNNGNYTWTAATNFRLGSQNPTNNTTWDVSRVNATSNVAPGQTGVFDFIIRAPSTPGVYNLQWRMLQENVAWFGDLTPNMPIKVLSGSISASPTTCLIPPTSSTCTATLNWTSNSSTSEVWVSGLDGSSPQIFSRNQNGSQAASWISTRGSRFTLKSDGYVLDSIDVRGIPAPEVGVTGSLDYDELGRLIARRNSADQVKVSYEYDGNGNITKITNAAGYTTLTYDALDRLSTMTDAARHTTTYKYDIANRLTRVTDPRGNTTTYTYDGFGQLWQQVSPDTGTTTFAYDPYGLLMSMTRADGVQTNYDYDALYRLTTTSAGGQSQQATYDTCANGVGRLCSVSDSTGTTSYSYTPEGQIAGRGFSIGDTTYALGYGYDVSGRVASVVYPDGNKVSYTYAHGLVSSATATVGGAATGVATNVLYRAGDHGALAAWTSSNGIVNRLGYDDDGRLTGISVSGVQSLSFYYDDVDRISHIVNGMNDALSQDFQYDAVSRLKSVNSMADNESFSYDANGNRITQVVNGVATISTISSTSNRVVNYGSQAIGYDVNGNTVSVNGVTKYHYDAFNRLDSAGGMSYYVNPEGQRLRKSGGVGTFYFAPDRGGAMLAEYTQGAWLDYVWLNGRLIGRIAGGQLYAVHTDQVGRPEAVTDAARGVVWRAQNFAFNRSVVTSAIPMNLGFPGQYFDAETSVWNNGYRDYSSEMGRYLQSDPIGLGGGVNTYIYVGNNPLVGTDPLGLYCLKEWQIRGVAGAAVGGVLGGLAGSESGPGALLTAAAGIIINGGIGVVDGLMNEGQAGGAALGAMGAMAGGGTKLDLSSGLVGGALGGALSSSLEGDGHSRYVSQGLGAGAGASVGSVVTGYFRNIPIRTIAKGAMKGGAIGLAAGLVQTGLEDALRAGNDCGCNK